MHRAQSQYNPFSIHQERSILGPACMLIWVNNYLDQGTHLPDSPHGYNPHR